MSEEIDLDEWTNRVLIKKQYKMEKITPSTYKRGIVYFTDKKDNRRKKASYDIKTHIFTIENA